MKDIQDLIDNNEISDSSYLGTEFGYELPSLILEVCVIMDENGEPTRKVLRRLGEERVAFLKNKHIDDWQVVAEMEYAMCSLSTESPADIAAAVLYYFHISKEFLLAAYLVSKRRQPDVPTPKKVLAVITKLLSK